MDSRQLPIKDNRLRLIFDLFPCQTESRLRGIGRYCLSLAKAMAATRGEHELRLFTNGLYPESAIGLQNAFGGLVSAGALTSYSHPPLGAAGSDDADHENVASALIQAAYQAVGPDAVLCASPFEGWSERGMAAQPDAVLPSGLRVAILYDFIPLLFPAQHLEPSPIHAAWYQRRLANLQHVDLFLAISEATRLDAIRILGVAPERVVNIGGAADRHFSVLPDREAVSLAVQQLGITRPFVLYTGNADYRKNLPGLLQAYALLPAALRDDHQLVVNQVGNLELFREQVRRAGLGDDEVIVTGRVDDDTLVALCNACTAFVFPSLYEGFGLPILEAMQCGAPVIAAGNSSIPEVLGRDDALFDASRPADIAASLARVLSDHEWRAELARHGLEQARQFNWEYSARRAWRAIEDALPLAARTATPLTCAIFNAAGQATDDTLAVFAELATRHDLTFIDTAASPWSHLSVEGEQARATLGERLNQFDAVLYLAAPGALSPALVHLIRSAPGVLWESAASRQAPNPVHAPDPVLLLRDGGLQCLHAWLATGTAAAPGRSVHEGLLGLAIEDATAAHLLRERHGLSLPPLACLDAAHAVPGQRAAQLAALLAGAYGRDARRVAARISGSWDARKAGPDEVEILARHGQANLMSGRAARLLIDVTQLAHTDALSGIQRVVRNIARELCLMGEAVLPIELVRLHDGGLRRAGALAAKLLGHPPGAVPEGDIDIHPGDLLLMIDSSWEQYPQFVSVFDSVHRLGGRVVTVIYDLIPLRLPQFCDAGLVNVFQRWFGMAVQYSDMLLCISAAVRDDVALYLDQHRLRPAHRLQLEYWRLGADIVPEINDQAIRPEVAAMAADTASPLFLMVGTIEPRKGHQAVLDAFDALWEQGIDVRLCLAGKEGWDVADLMLRIRSHPQLNQRLFLVERFTDAEINLCYSRAHALLAASIAEGYGLPIVEAAQHRVPVIATDIPVFREVAGAGALYFPLGERTALMDLVRHFSTLEAREREAMAARVLILSWHASARQAWEKLLLTYT